MKIDSSLKREIFKAEGIGSRESRFLNFNDLSKNVLLGATVEATFKELDLDPQMAREFVIRYALHQIKRESVTLSEHEKAQVETYAEDSIGNLTLGKLLENTHFSDPEDYFLMHGQYISSFPINKVPDFMELAKKIFSGIPYSYDHLEETKDAGLSYIKSWNEYSNKLGSFFRLYNECGVIRAKKAISTAPNNLDGNEKCEKLFGSLIYHYKNYLDMLKCLPSNYDISEDLLLFERNTDLFFLLKVYTLLKKDNWFESISKHRQDEYLKVISSFSIIDDLNLKLYLVERFIEEGSSLSFVETALGFVPFFRLNFLQIPLLKESIKEAILEFSENALKQNEKGRKIKAKMACYLFLEEFHSYKIKDFDSNPVLSIDLSTIAYSDLFLMLYKKVYNIRNSREEIVSQSKKKIFNFIEHSGENVLNDWDENIQALMHLEAKTLKSKLVLNNMEPEFIDIYEQCESSGFFERLDHEGIKRKLLDANINPKEFDFE